MNQQLTKKWHTDAGQVDGHPSIARPSLADRLSAGMVAIDWYVRKSPEYRSWRMMHGRCSPNACHSNRMKYYDKGIRISPAYANFWDFFKDMGERAADENLARHDDSKDFEPGNCYWQPSRVRMSMRVRPAKMGYVWKGQTYSEHQLARALAVDRHHISQTRHAGGITENVTEQAVDCLMALQTARIECDGRVLTLMQWASVLTCHISLLRFRLRKGIAPSDIIKGLMRHG